MISTSLKTELVNKTHSLITKARVNDAVVITSLTFTPNVDSLTIEFNFPTGLVVNKVELLDVTDNVTTTISNLNIDTSVSTVFSHNIQFVQGGV